MIEALDKTLRQLFNRDLASENISGVSVSFVTPDKEWAGTIGGPTINLFLYDIRENLQLRSNDQYISKAGITGVQSYSPVRIDFTYLISVWTKKGGDSGDHDHVVDEHKLLGSILKILLRYSNLPKDLLQGELQEQLKIPGAQLPRAWIAQPEDTPKTWEFWGSNEWRLKAGISYRVTLYIQPQPQPIELVTKTQIDLELVE